MANAAEIFEQVRKCFDQMGIPYELISERRTIKTTIPLRGKIKNVNIYLNCNDDSYTVNAYLPFVADEESRTSIAELFTRINYKLIFGSFELDFDDGEISYRLTLDCECRAELSEDLVVKTIGISIGSIDKYSNGIVSVLFGIKSPKEAALEGMANSAGTVPVDEMTDCTTSDETAKEDDTTVDVDYDMTALYENMITRPMFDIPELIVTIPTGCVTSKNTPVNLYLKNRNGKLIMTDNGSTRSFLDSIYELDKPDVFTPILATTDYYGISTEEKQLSIEVEESEGSITEAYMKHLWCISFLDEMQLLFK